jgi:hypothetical protein
MATQTSAWSNDSKRSRPQIAKKDRSASTLIQSPAHPLPPANPARRGRMRLRENAVLHQAREAPKQRHVQFRRPDGALYSEELFGTEGFVRPYQHHVPHPPADAGEWMEGAVQDQARVRREDVMRMRHSKTAQMKANGDSVTGRVVLFGNSDVEMAVCVPKPDVVPLQERPGGRVPLRSLRQRHGLHHVRHAEVRTQEGLHRHPQGHDLPDRVERGRPTPIRPANYTKAEMPWGKFVCFETANGSHIGPPPRYRLEGQWPVPGAFAPIASVTSAPAGTAADVRRAGRV